MGIQRNGDLIQIDFFNNTGGLNTSNSPFAVEDNQATGGANYTYAKTGAVQSRRGHDTINTVADTELISLGLGLHATASGTKTNIRAAGRRLQAVDVGASSFTNLSEDKLAASTTPFLSGSTQPVVFSQFNTALGNVLWGAGGGATNIVGATGATKYTTNGIAVPTGSFSATPAASGTGAFAATGTYFYAVVYRKASTQVISNAVLDVSATISNTTDTVVINLAGLTGLDTTLVDKVYLYRSAVSGVTAFTTGDLVAQITSSVTSYTDTGTYITTSTNVPRSGNTILDNTQLTSGTYNVLTTWKRRLVTATGSVISISDTNKPESWPTGNTITIPSGGPITGVAIISFSTQFSNDEYLAVFKERELWIITGSSIADWVLKFVDNVGCPNQPLIVTANGYLFWVDYRGFYLWDGAGKPTYLSKPIEDLFDFDGFLNKQYLSIGCGAFSRKQHEVIWYLSHKVYGVQKFAVRLDLRLTLPRIADGLEGRTLDGCFLLDVPSIYVYSAFSYLPSSTSDEILLLGDSTGKIYKGYTVYSDGGSAYSFTYKTKAIDAGNPNKNKRWLKVIAWVDQVGDWPLYLDYWTGYKDDPQVMSTVTGTINTSQQNSTSLWDIAFWDTAYWDSYSPRGIPLIFNLKPDVNNALDGPALKLQFRQDTISSPVVLNGWSILCTEGGMVQERGRV